MWVAEHPRIAHRPARPGDGGAARRAAGGRQGRGRHGGRRRHRLGRQGDRGAVLGLHPRTGKVLRRIVTADDAGARRRRAERAVDRRARVARGPGLPAALRPRRHRRVLRTEEFADGIQAIALGGGAAWVALKRSKRIVRVGPGAAPDPFTVLRSPASSLAYGAGYVWATVPEGDTLVRVAQGRGQTLHHRRRARPVRRRRGRRAGVRDQLTSHKVLVFEPERLRRRAAPARRRGQPLRRRGRRRPRMGDGPRPQHPHADRLLSGPARLRGAVPRRRLSRWTSSTLRLPSSWPSGSRPSAAARRSSCCATATGASGSSSSRRSGRR